MSGDGSRCSFTCCCCCWSPVQVRQVACTVIDTCMRSYLIASTASESCHVTSRRPVSCRHEHDTYNVQHALQNSSNTMRGVLRVCGSTQKTCYCSWLDTPATVHLCTSSFHQLKHQLSIYMIVVRSDRARHGRRLVTMWVGDIAAMHSRHGVDAYCSSSCLWCSVATTAALISVSVCLCLSVCLYCLKNSSSIHSLTQHRCSSPFPGFASLTHQPCNLIISDLISPSADTSLQRVGLADPDHGICRVDTRVASWMAWA